MLGVLLFSFAAQTASTPSVSEEREERKRVFVAQLQAGEGTSKPQVSLVADAVLVSARRHQTLFEVLSAADLSGVLELEAEKMALGCDVVSCASEVADALNAPQLITGQIGKVGETWLLTLTRTDRSTLKSLSRSQIQAEGDAPDVLFSELDAAVDALFGDGGSIVVESAPPALLYGGLGALGGGAAVAVVGGALLGISWLIFLDAGNKPLAARTTARDVGEPMSILGVAGMTVGGVVAAVGLGLVGADLLLGAE